MNLGAIAAHEMLMKLTKDWKKNYSFFGSRCFWLAIEQFGCTPTNWLKYLIFFNFLGLMETSLTTFWIMKH
jgi:hypothetical protein